MNVLGLITEYNPFHNGHLHHLKASKELTQATHTVAVMSGHFVQRGEPAIFDKWTRAAMAVYSGVDLVLELPTVFAVSSAEYFAFGAVDLLNKLGMVTDVVFGSESGYIDDFYAVTKLLTEHTTLLDAHIQKNLATGISYPSARQMALNALISETDPQLSELLASPNNILGIEYLKALQMLKSAIRPHTIPRIASDYNSTQLQGEISSATAIRAHLHNLQTTAAESSNACAFTPRSLSTLSKDLTSFIPASALQALSESFKAPSNLQIPVFPDHLTDMLLYRLRSISTTDLAQIHDVKEGLENRIKNSAQRAGNWKELLEGMQSKRYPLTRLQRILIKTLLGIRDDYVGRTGHLRAEYARVLAFNDKGRELLAIMRKEASLPIVTRPSKTTLSSEATTMLSYDLLATDLYALLVTHLDDKRGGKDFTQLPIYIK